MHRISLLIVGAMLAWSCKAADPLPQALPPGDYTPIPKPMTERSAGETPEFREQALRRAKLWTNPPVPLEQVDFAKRPEKFISCKLHVGPVGGTTPKFECVLPDRELLRVKYAKGNPEIPGEVAASRLMSALGFITDKNDLAQRVRCFGCPSDPFKALTCLNGGTPAQCLPSLDFNKFSDFDFVGTERRFEGRTVQTEEIEGWRWDELSKIDPAAGGASRAEVDALRLMAVFLGHWDNKAENQRIVCLPGPGGDCDRAYLLIQDLGSTFGPKRVHLKNWRETPVWRDAASCAVSLKSLPYRGGTFPDEVISEGGRQLLAGLLSKFSAEQIRALFEASGFARVPQGDPKGGELESWVAAFQDKVRQIAERPPCPTGK